MKRYSVDKKASLALAGYFLLISLLYVLLHSELNYKAGIFAGVNLLLMFAIIWAYRLWIAPSLKVLAATSQQILDSPSEDDQLVLAINALNKQKAENSRAIAFIDAIGRGELGSNQAAVFTGASEGSLGAALLKMSHQLHIMAEKEKERNWVTEKMAAFSEIFRTNNDNLPDFCNTVVSRLVKYVDANQAALFVLNDEQEQNSYLEMVACYAYDRKKYLKKQVLIGEGLLGQTFLEKEAVFLTDIPKGYTSITSGLGDASPNYLLLVPIKQNDEVLGVLEIASFKKLQPFHLEFIEKMSEGVASAISTTKIREHTTKLLQESLTQAQELKAQEEEMRQNMEEMQATQEASYRMQEELRRNEQKQLERIEELSQARLIMQEQEAKLRDSQEKAQKRSLKFKEKMELLDMEIEGKNAQIKSLMKQVQAIQEKFSLTEEELLSYK